MATATVSATDLEIDPLPATIPDREVQTTSSKSDPLEDVAEASRIVDAGVPVSSQTFLRP